MIRDLDEKYLKPKDCKLFLSDLQDSIYDTDHLFKCSKNDDTCNKCLTLKYFKCILSLFIKITTLASIKIEPNQDLDHQFICKMSSLKNTYVAFKENQKKSEADTYLSRQAARSMCCSTSKNYFYQFFISFCARLENTNVVLLDEEKEKRLRFLFCLFFPDACNRKERAFIKLLKKRLKKISPLVEEELYYKKAQQCLIKTGNRSKLFSWYYELFDMLLKVLEMCDEQDGKMIWKTIVDRIRSA